MNRRDWIILEKLFDPKILADKIALEIKMWQGFCHSLEQRCQSTHCLQLSHET